MSAFTDRNGQRRPLLGGAHAGYMGWEIGACFECGHALGVSPIQRQELDADPAAAMVCAPCILGLVCEGRIVELGPPTEAKVDAAVRTLAAVIPFPQTAQKRHKEK